MCNKHVCLKTQHFKVLLHTQLLRAWVGIRIQGSSLKKGPKTSPNEFLALTCVHTITKKGLLYFAHASYTESLFAESKFNLSFCLGICFCVKVHLILQAILIGHLTFNCSLGMVFGIHFRTPFCRFGNNFLIFLKNIWLALELTKCGPRVVHKLFNKTMRKLSAELSNGGPRHF